MRHAVSQPAIINFLNVLGITKNQKELKILLYDFVINMVRLGIGLECIHIVF
jgi:hypothetical protein